MHLSLTLLVAVGCAGVHAFRPAIKERIQAVTAQLKNAALVVGTVTLLSSSVLPAEAAVTVNTYINQRYHTKIDYPSDWEDKTALLPSDSGYVDSRMLVAFVDPKNADVSASLVFSPVPADFARLTSFGGKDNLRSYVMPKGTADFPISYEVLNENVKGETYTAEYIISAPDVPTRHVISAFALRPAESVVGLTVQCKEGDFPQFKEKLSVVLPSFTVDLP
jgi:hypothetical protein